MTRNATLFICSIAVGFGNVAHGGSVIGDGTRQWADAARAGRADMLILGDSIVSYGEHGWAAGIAGAAQRSIGLSGSGLLGAAGDLPFVWDTTAGARIWHGAPSTAAEAPAGTGGYGFAGQFYTAPGNFAFVGTGTDAIALPSDEAYDFHTFTAARAPDATLQASRHRRSPVTFSDETLQTSPVRTLTTPAGGLSHDVFHFDAPGTSGAWETFDLTDRSRDAALFYTKLTRSAATGISISGLGLAGGTTADFRAGYYDNARWDAAGRGVFYDALTAGDSGKLNVVLAFGVNDAGSKSASAFAADIAGLMADVRRDWSGAGKSAGDLSFTLLSTYHVDPSAVPAEAREAYAAAIASYPDALAALAAGDPSVSFVDLWHEGPTLADALANGYLADGFHPTPAGSQVYGSFVLASLLPEPGTACAGACFAFAAARRRRSA